jgi:hypothetical protein
MRSLVAITALLMLSSCASFSQKQIEAGWISNQRICDANAASKHPSLLVRLSKCGGPALPPECERPGTDDLPACQRWVNTMRQLMDQQTITNAAIEGAL